MPEVGPGLYLIEAFHLLRFATPGPMGEGLQAQSWQEVLAFAEATGRITEPWELEALFNMSWAYVTEHTKAADALRVSPMERTDHG